MSRKLLSLVLASCMLFALGSNALAQTGASASITSGLIFPDNINGLDHKVGHTGTYTYTLQMESGVNVTGATLGLVLFSPDGSLTNITWVSVPVGLNTWGAGATWNFGGPKLTLGPDAFSGSLPSTWLTGGVSDGSPGTGYGPIGLTDGLNFTITFPGVDGGILCLDSAFFPPAGNWLMSPAAVANWSGGGGAGAFGSSTAGLCVTTFVIPDLPPVFTACADTLTTSHCDALNYKVTAVDQDTPPEPIAYSAATSGAGTVSVDASGNVQYVPAALETGSITVTITASEIPDAGAGPTADCVTTINITNVAPVLSCTDSLAVAKGNSNTSPDATLTDPDACDSHVYSLVSVTPTPTGTVTVDANGAITFAADVSDAVGGVDTDYDVVIQVSDGMDVATCTTVFTVLNTEPFCVRIDQTDKITPPGTIQGSQVNVYINFDGGSNSLGGFDFLIKYDNSALSFIGATEGNIFPDYEWEMFTYRFGPNGNCSGGCPSGKLRVIGLAETNNGMHRPTNFLLVAGDQFACLKFLVSNDRTLECQFVPIRFCWIDCGDNSLSSSSGDTLYISRNVFDYIGTDMANVVSGFRANITGNGSFPTLTGAPDVCDVATDKGAPLRFVDYKNGGVRIICAGEIDDRGDININGLSNEISDAVMLTEYFVSGLGAFIDDNNVSHVDASTAASDVNADGIPLSVADLVYLIRVIIGDALPVPKIVPNAEAITITSKDGVISSSADMGAALFVFDGIAEVTLLANNMDLKVGVVDGNTHALVHSSLERDNIQHISAGDVISSAGTLVSVDASDVNGIALAPGLDLVVPTSFAVYQNYPNPFNPNTKINFDLPNVAKYSVRIYNVAGQLVKEFSGEDVGQVTVDVDASAWASGIYFYKVSANGLSTTKKMVLLK